MGKVVNIRIRFVDSRTSESWALAKRSSRWIKIRHTYYPNKRNTLWYYVTDGYGNRPDHKDFTRSHGLFLDYFVWHGKKYAIDQFIRFGTFYTPEIMSYFENKKEIYLSGYDSENYYNPIMIEVDEGGERVRVYESM